MVLLPSASKHSAWWWWQGSGRVSYVVIWVLLITDVPFPRLLQKAGLSSLNLSSWLTRCCCPLGSETASGLALSLQIPEAGAQVWERRFLGPCRGFVALSICLHFLKHATPPLSGDKRLLGSQFCRSWRHIPSTG
jgi:hypothetical protein